MAICDILVTINVLVVGIIYICKVQELPEKDPPPPPPITKSGFSVCVILEKFLEKLIT